MKKDLLAAYKAKRHFDNTSEPSGKKTNLKRKYPIFVIQKHAARRLHYDLRLEVGGVLKSWAVPKGPSTDPRDKRLAVHTEDHPMDYAVFEGIIPRGEYGAGKVIVWDYGVYQNLSKKNDEPISMEKALEKGHVRVWLEGTKISGAYSLSRMATREENPPWLLIKIKDNAPTKNQPVLSKPKSALSGKAIEEIK